MMRVSSFSAFPKTTHGTGQMRTAWVVWGVLPPFVFIFFIISFRVCIFYPYLNGFFSSSPKKEEAEVWVVIKYHTLYIHEGAKGKYQPRKGSDSENIKNTTHIWHPPGQIHPKKKTKEWKARHTQMRLSLRWNKEGKKMLLKKAKMINDTLIWACVCFREIFYSFRWEAPWRLH